MKENTSFNIYIASKQSLKPKFSILTLPNSDCWYFRMFGREIEPRRLLVCQFINPKLAWSLTKQNSNI